MAKLKHIAIATQEPDKTAKFYTNVFDLKVVGKVDTEKAEGFYLSDGNINIAVLKFKSEDAAGGEYGTEYEGIHHIGFQVDDLSEVDTRLREAEASPRKDMDINSNGGMGKGHGGRNVSTKYDGPDGVTLDVSQGGWVGT